MADIASREIKIKKEPSNITTKGVLKWTLIIGIGSLIAWWLIVVVIGLVFRVVTPRQQSKNIRENYTSAADRPADITAAKEIEFQKTLYSSSTGITAGQTLPCRPPNATQQSVHRKVRCFSSTGVEMADSLCPTGTKPVSITSLPFPVDCPTYQWKATDWQTSTTLAEASTSFNTCSADGVCTGGTTTTTGTVATTPTRAEVTEMSCNGPGPSGVCEGAGYVCGYNVGLDPLKCYVA